MTRDTLTLIAMLVATVYNTYEQSRVWAAQAMGLRAPGQVAVFVHTGSRGCGHQICDDYLRVMERAVRRYGISLPDRQLACAPIDSPEGRDYVAAMACGANYAWANRQAITHQAGLSRRVARLRPLAVIKG